TLEEDGSLDQLAAQIENDPEGLWLALQGLSAIEPEIRAQIIGGLAQVVEAPGPNLIEFLRLLNYAHEPATRAAALDALAGVPLDDDDPKLVAAWASLAADPPDPEVSERARRWLGRHDRGVLARPSSSQATSLQTTPRLVRSLVTAIDG